MVATGFGELLILVMMFAGGSGLVPEPMQSLSSVAIRKAAPAAFLVLAGGAEKMEATSAAPPKPVPAQK